MTSSTTRRRLLAGACTAAIGAVAGCTLLDDEAHATATQQFDADGVARLAIESETGNVAVHGHDGDAIRVEADKRASNEDRLDAVTVDGRQRGDRLRLETDLDPSSGLFERADDARLHLAVAVPEGVVVERVNTVSGAVEVDGVTGPIEAIADAGDVYVSAVEGAVDARTEEGNVTVRDVTGTIDARTDAGDVSVDGVIGTLRTDAGEIRATVRGLGDDPSIRGTATDVALAIARDVDVTVEADVDLGDLDVHGEGIETAAAEAAQSVRLVVGEGEDRLRIETRAGDVSVTTV